MSKLCEACVNARCSVELHVDFVLELQFVKTKETVADAELGVAGKKEKTSCRRKRWTNRLPRLICPLQLPPKETSSLNPEQNLLDRIPHATHSSGQVNLQDNINR